MAAADVATDPHAGDDAAPAEELAGVPSEVPDDVLALDDRAPRDPFGPARVKRPEALATLVSVVGLLVQTVGYAAGWAGHDGPATALWYLGFVVIVAPFAWLLLAPSRTGHQRLGASLAFGVVMYGSWLLSDPVMSTRFDETLHVTTLVDMIDLHRFFYPNTMLPVSPHYPGLELATAGVHWLTGLPLIASEIVVDLVARSIFILTLFLLASRIGRSTQVGAATVLLYGGSAQFYFFNSQFAYQTLAIAMLMSALYLLVRAFDSEVEWPWKELVAVQVCLGALAVTHHLTSWIMLGLLWLLSLAFQLGGERRRARLTVMTAEVATIVVAAWTAVIAPLLVGYLGPIFDGATAQLTGLLDGTGAARSPGSASNGQAAPTWELMLMAASILLWLLLLVPASWVSWRRRALGRTTARYVPLLVAIAYPTLQVGRFSEAAGEVADRASTFVGMAMALVVGAWLAHRLQIYGRLVIPGAVVLILGGTLLGSGPDWSRVPGPYLAGAEQRSVDSETVAVAQWAGTYLPKDAHVAADSTFSRVLPNFAPVIPLTEPAGYDSMTPLFLAHSVDSNVLRLILHNNVDFIFVDTRTIGQTVLSGAFYEGSNGYPNANTVYADQITKFAHARGFHLILDGPVKVYDVRDLRGAPTTFPAPRPPPGIPGTWTPWQLGFSGLLLLLGLLMRGRILDPRRFRAKDVWRFAIVLPIAMVIGAIGIAAQFTPVAGAVAAAVVLYVLVALSDRPEPLPDGPRGALRWTLAIGVVSLAAVLLATYAAWHGLLDHSALPAPIREAAS